MAQQDQWWLNDKPVAQAASRGVEIPAPGPTEEDARKAAIEAERLRMAQAKEGREVVEFEREQAGGKPTEAQQKTLTLLTRIAGGARDIQGVTERNSAAQEPGLAETTARGIMGEGITSRAIAGADRRIVTDAQRDVLDALLTLGTGAAYNKEQLEGATLSHFPQYNDTPEEIAVKNDRLNRLIVSARLSAGPMAAKFDESIAPLLGKATAPQAAAPLQVAEGETYSTDEDIAQAKTLTDAWKGGATIEQIQGMLRPGESLTPEDIERLKADTNRALPFGPASSGKRSDVGAAVGDVAGSPLGSYAVGAANALTAGTMDELAPLIGLDAAQVQLAKEYLAQKNPVSSFAGEVTGGAMAMAPIGRAMGAAGLGTRAALAGDVAYGAAYGAGQSNENRLLGGLTGGLVSGAAGSAARRFLPGGGTPQGVATGMDDIATGGLPAAEQAGIRVMTSDVAPPTSFVGRSAQQLGERIPFAGTGGQRAAQQGERINAVQDVINEFGGVDVSELPETIMRDLTETRSAELTKFADMKKDVIGRIAATGEVVPADKTVEAIDKQIVELTQRGTKAATDVVEYLQGLRRDVQGKTLDQLEAIRQDELSNAFKGGDSMADIRAVAERAIRKVYDPLRQDMGDFIKANGERADFNKWMVANKRLSELSGERVVSGLRSVLKSGDATPELVEQLLFSARPSDVRLLYRNLSPKGRVAAQSAIMGRALKNMGGDIESVSPEKFVTQARKLGSQIGVFFSGDEAARVNGLVRALKLTRRAGEAGVLTNSGQQAIPIIGATALLDVAGTGGGAMATGAGIGLLARAYESKVTRNLLLNLGRTKPGSEAESALASKVGAALKSLATVGAVDGVSDTSPEKQPGAITPQIGAQ